MGVSIQTRVYTYKEGKNRIFFLFFAKNELFDETNRDAAAGVGEAPASFSNASVNEFTEVPGESDEDLPF